MRFSVRSHAWCKYNPTSKDPCTRTITAVGFMSRKIQLSSHRSRFSWHIISSWIKERKLCKGSNLSADESITEYCICYCLWQLCVIKLGIKVVYTASICNFFNWREACDTTRTRKSFTFTENAHPWCLK